MSGGSSGPMFRYDMVETRLLLLVLQWTRQDVEHYRAAAYLWGMVDLIAKLDYFQLDPMQARACVWQEVDVAFRGHGSALMAAVVQGFPVHEDGLSVDGPYGAIEAIFREAWAATPIDVELLFPGGYQTTPFGGDFYKEPEAWPRLGVRSGLFRAADFPTAMPTLDSLEWLTLPLWMSLTHSESIPALEPTLQLVGAEVRPAAPHGESHFAIDVLEAGFRRLFRRSRALAVRRAVRLVWLWIDLVAMVDYADSPPIWARSYAWQVLEEGLRGRGDQLTEAVIQTLRLSLGAQWLAWVDALEALFDEAWLATDPSCRRVFGPTGGKAFNRGEPMESVLLSRCGLVARLTAADRDPEVAASNLRLLEQLVDSGELLRQVMAKKAAAEATIAEADDTPASAAAAPDAPDNVVRITQWAKAQGHAPES